MTINGFGRILSQVFMVSSHSVSIYTGSQLIPRKGVNGTLFGLALLTVAARMGIRYHSQRQLQADDFVLIFATLTLIASQIILYILKMDGSFWIEALILDPSSAQILVTILEDPEAFYRGISKLQRMQYSSFVLTWASIYGVKICFLLFFRPMTTRLRRLGLAWKVTSGITKLFCAICTCTIFISCPHFGPTACK